MFKGVMTEAEAVESFNERILGMMADHCIPMSEALWWDFEGVFYVKTTDVYKRGGFDLVEKQFRNYLINNGLTKQENLDFYTDIFMGRSEDLQLRKENE